MNYSVLYLIFHPQPSVIDAALAKHFPNRVVLWSAADQQFADQAIVLASAEDVALGLDRLANRQVIVLNCLPDELISQNCRNQLQQQGIFWQVTDVPEHLAWVVEKAIKLCHGISLPTSASPAVVAQPAVKPVPSNVSTASEPLSSQRSFSRGIGRAGNDTPRRWRR